MKQLTEYQKNYLLSFFENPNYAGWKAIADKLLTSGECIVAGVVKTFNDRIWSGGVGNFIDYSDAKNAVGCTMYVFDLDEFLSSAWFKENKKNYYLKLEERKEEFIQKIYTLENEMGEIELL